MRKTARTVVWEGAGAQSPAPDPIRGGAPGLAGISGKIDSAASDDTDDLEAIARLEVAIRELRRGHRLAIELHHDAARGEAAPAEELLERARELGRNGLPIGDDRHGRSVVPADGM